LWSGVPGAVLAAGDRIGLREHCLTQIKALVARLLRHYYWSRRSKEEPR
jgi:hypothetical protein